MLPDRTSAQRLADSQDVVEAILIECSQALFEHYGVRLERVRNAEVAEIWDEHLSLAGVIGFTSEAMRGSLVLAVGKRPLSLIEAEERHHRDWIQELSNQLLGRVKNRLLPFGIDLKMTTPLSLRATHLTLEPCISTSSPLLFRTSDGGALCVLLDAEHDPEFELSKSEAADKACLDEGSLLLF